MSGWVVTGGLTLMWLGAYYVGYQHGYKKSHDRRFFECFDAWQESVAKIYGTVRPKNRDRVTSFHTDRPPYDQDQER